MAAMAPPPQHRPWRARWLRFSFVTCRRDCRLTLSNASSRTTVLQIFASANQEEFLGSSVKNCGFVDYDVETAAAQAQSQMHRSFLCNSYVNLLQEGRMRGQAFVTFPSTDSDAMGMTHGFVLKGKPMIVQFRRNRCAAKTQ